MRLWGHSSDHQFYRISCERILEPEVTLLMHFLQPPVWPSKIQRGWVTCWEMNNQIGTKFELESGSPDSLSSFISGIPSYYLSSTYSGPDVILDTILTIFIQQAFPIHLRCARHIWRGYSYEQNKSGSCLQSLHSSVHVSTELCHHRALPSGKKLLWNV